MRLVQRTSRSYLLVLLLSTWTYARTAQSITTAPDTPPSSPSTCRSGSINYITQTLAQQCVASNRTAAPSWQSTSSQSSSQKPATASAERSQESATPAHRTEVTHAHVTESSSDGQPSVERPSNAASPLGSEAPAVTISVGIDTAVGDDTDADTDQDSPLDNANFLSFEDWKRKNLAQAGQSPEDVGQHRASDDMRWRARPGINNALDVLGEDSEIELDFSGFGGAQEHQQTQYHSKGPQNADRADVVPKDKPSSQQSARSKDAGRTCKERTNYASFDCAASVLKTNQECKSAASVLVENKDSYMLNICKVQNKYFIVELCNDILIDTVVLANYEFFSSIFRTFRLSVSDRYPVKEDKWRILGVYEARNVRSVQAFLVEEPLIWARYLRIEILTHYGNEYYCPVSLLRVHGTTMMEEFRHQEEIARGEYVDEEPVIGANNEEESLPPLPTIAQEPLVSSEKADASATEAVSITAMETPLESVVSSGSHETPSTGGPLPSVDENVLTHSSSTGPASIPSQDTPRDSSPDQQTSTSEGNGSNATTKAEMTEMASSSPIDSQHVNSTIIGLSNESIHTSTVSDTPDTPGENATIGQPDILPEMQLNATAESSVKSTSQPQNGGPVTSSSTASIKAPSASQNGHDSVKRPSPTSNGAPPAPSTQESFFKSIHKRLQMLESNSTLSLQYIEEQSRILRDAFAKVEKRQVRKTERFLESLNVTVTRELQSFRKEYDQLWQSTVIELETSRQMYQQEILAVSSRLNLVAEELLFQKRMFIVQSTLVVLCIALVLFHRAGPNALDLPIVQQMLNKSPVMRSYSGVYSPPSSPPVGSYKYGRAAFWRRSLSPSQAAEMMGNGRVKEGGESPSPPVYKTGPDVTFQAPTPASPRSMVDENYDDGDYEEEDSEISAGSRESPPEDELPSDPARVLETIETDEVPIATAPMETQSAPSTPLGSREASATPQMLDTAGAMNSGVDMVEASL